MNPTIETILAHRSIRRFKPDPVPPDHVRAAVAAGQAASTSSAVQASCVIHVTDPAERARLAELTGPQEKVATAGAFLVVAGDTRRHRLAARRDGQPHEPSLESFLVAVIDASLLAQNMTLAFESMGYGCCYIGGLRNHLPEVDRLLEIPEGVYPIYGLCVGVPDEDPSHRPRLPVEAVLSEGRYPSDEEVLAHLAAYDATYERYLAERGAEPRTWSGIMARKFTAAQRPDLAGYYRSKGASLG
jgi:FMN reductase (NADPH)